MSLSAAQSRVLHASRQLESGDLGGVDATLVDAEGLLVGLPEDEAAPVVARIAALRARLRAMATVARSTQVAALRADFIATAAASEVTVTTRVAGPEAAVAGPDAAVAAPLRRLEELVATDPFAGLHHVAANRRASELHSLRAEVVRALDAAPPDAPETRALVRRLEATDVKIAVADAEWARAGLRAEVRHFWQIIKEEIDGWADENPPARPLAEPDLPLTRLAIQRVAYLLADPKTHQTRDDNAGDPVIRGTYREADEVFAAAGAKMAAAFATVLDAAERMPVPAPESTFELDKPRMLAGAAERALAGTPHLDVTVARARWLDARWQAEVAAVRRARQDLYDKLSVEADAAWPGIVAATGATGDDDLTTGRVVLLRGHNRAGSDFHGDDFPFALRLNGTPVGGVYEPHVRRALEHAWYELKLDVNDRIAWDVVGVVEGRGKIGEKVVRAVRSAETDLEVGKVEEWPPVDCVRIRIIALHAGPVAVGR